jgi:hypothetical protein
MPKSKNNVKLASLKEKYQVQLDSLQVELEQANRDNNVEKAVEVLEQKAETKKALNEVEVVEKTEWNNCFSPQEKVTAKVEVIEVEQSSAQSKELVKMTPAELELLIDKIMEETHPSKKRESFYGSRATQ